MIVEGKLTDKEKFVMPMGREIPTSAMTVEGELSDKEKKVMQMPRRSMISKAR